MSLPTVKCWNMFAWGMAWLVVTLSLVFCVYAEAMAHERFGESAVTAIGQVTDFTPGWSDPGPMGDGEPPVVEYTFETREGRRFSGTGEAHAQIGARVPIEYQSNDPSLNRIAPSESGSRGRIVELLLLPGLAALVALWFLQQTFQRSAAPSDAPPARVPIVMLCGGAAVILAEAVWSKHGHGFYVVLRWLVCVAALVAGSYSLRWGFRWTPWLCGAVAVVFNPFAPIPLSRDVWVPIDLVVTVLMIVVANRTTPRTGQLAEGS